MTRPNRTILWFILGILLGQTSTNASILEILSDPQGSIADLRESFIEFDECLVQNKVRRCYKMLWDPPEFITEGTLTVELVPTDGSTVERFGEVLSINFFNGYAGTFERFVEEDRVIFEVPFRSVERPPLEGDTLDIVELMVADDGEDEPFVNFGGSFSGRGIMVDDGTGNVVPAEVIPAVFDFAGYDLVLTPEQEVPTPTIPGGDEGPVGNGPIAAHLPGPHGHALVSVDKITGRTSVMGEYANMTSDVTGAHLHGLAGVGETAGVIFGFNHTDGTDGTFEGKSILSPENLQGLMDGLTYLNVHTVNNPPGEVRAQIVPEPASAMIVALCLCLMGGRLRKRRISAFWYHDVVKFQSPGSRSAPWE